MSDLTFSPWFVLQKMLKLPFNRVQARKLQEITGKSEKTIYNWFSREEMAKPSDYRNLMEVFSKHEACTGCPVNSREFIRGFKNPDWGEFAAIWLQNENNDFRLTMGTILENLYSNNIAGVKDLDPHRLGSCLPLAVINKLKGSLTQKGLRQELLDDFVEVIAFIFFLALLESEYSEDTKMDHSFIEKVLPRYINREKSLVSTPTELFFQNLLDGFIDKSLFKDKSDLAKQIEHWMALEDAEGAQREMDRYSNSEISPKWHTFNKWIEMVITKFQQEEKEGVKKSKEEWEEREESERLHLQNLYGGALLLDKAFKLSERMLAQEGFDPVDFFRQEYGACAERMKKRGG